MKNQIKTKKNVIFFVIFFVFLIFSFKIKKKVYFLKKLKKNKSFVGPSRDLNPGPHAN